MTNPSNWEEGTKTRKLIKSYLHRKYSNAPEALVRYRIISLKPNIIFVCTREPKVYHIYYKKGSFRPYSVGLQIPTWCAKTWRIKFYILYYTKRNI